MTNNSQEWLKLDNAAKIYPASSGRKSPAQFRLSASMKQNIYYNALNLAWESMLIRCPYYRVHLKKGFFWYYLQYDDFFPPVVKQKNIPQIIDPSKNHSELIKLSIKDNIISLDFSHLLTDGNGSLRFFMGLIYEYLRNCGYHINIPEGIPHSGNQIMPYELEDAHRSFFPGNLPHPEKLSRAFHLSGSPASKYRLLVGELPLQDVLNLARSHNVTVTAYLAALYIYCLQKIALNQKASANLPVRLQVPVDMRKVYPANTMRNFSLYVSPEIDLKLGEFDFKEILEKVSLSVKLQVSKKELSRQISRNVGGELNPFVRLVPRLFKDLYLSGLYSRLGEKCYSGVLSNLGKILVDESAKKYIESFQIFIMPNFRVKKAAAAYSYNDKLLISFCTVINDTNLERLFFSHFQNLGINVLVKE